MQVEFSDALTFVLVFPGEEAQILGRCVFLMRMPKEQCVLMMLMNP